MSSSDRRLIEKGLAQWYAEEIARLDTVPKTGMSETEVKAFAEYLEFCRSELAKLRLAGNK